MSTRSVVIVKDKNHKCSIYHHWDGYPEGVGYDLLQRSKRWTNSYVDSSDIVNNLLKDKNECYEFTFSIHSDIDYLYVIDCDTKKVKCFKVVFHFNEDGTFDENNWKKYEDIYEGTFGQEIDLYKEFPEIFEEKKEENKGE